VFEFKRPSAAGIWLNSESSKGSSRTICCTVLRARGEMMGAQTLSLRGPDMVGSF
jgi:hypothetical protein